jgi:hypothetical protein
MAKVNEDVAISEERIKIYGVNTKHKEKPFLATGIQDNVTKQLLTGQEDYSDKELKEFDFTINPNDHYMIRHNDELVLLKKGEVYIKNKALALYNLYKIQPNVAHSRSEVIQGVHDFYLQNFEAEADVKIKQSKIKAKAGGKVSDMNLTDMINMLYYFGDNAASLSTKRAEARIFEIAESSPEEVIKYFDDLEDNQKIVFIKKLLSKGFIYKAEGNQYLMYNKIVLGANEVEAAAFLYNNANEAIYLPLKDMLDKSK